MAVYIYRHQIYPLADFDKMPTPMKTTKQLNKMPTAP